MFRMISGKKTTAFLVILSLLAVYMPTAVFADAPLVTAVHSNWDITAKSVDITVTITENLNTITSAKLYYSTNESDVKGGMYKSIDTSTKKHTIDELSADTTYYYLAEIEYNDGLGGSPQTRESTQGSFRTIQADVPPSVTTDRAYFDSFMQKLFMNGTVNEGTFFDSSKIEKGFVYSYTNSQPTVSDSIVPQNLVNLTPTLNASMIPDTGKATCYVRAYIKTTTYGAVYGDAITVSCNIAKPAVRMDSATYDSNTKKITANGTVTTNTPDLYEKGFVYSYTNNPPILQSDTLERVTGSTYTATITPPDLTKTTYYVRAYAMSNTGAFVYSDTTATVTLSATANPPELTTEPVTSASIAATTATANINITKEGSGFTSAGVVCATDSSKLTINTSGTINAPISTNNAGPKSVGLTGLNPNTTYHVKGYVLSGGVPIYASNSQQFTTKTASAPSVAATTVSSYTDKTAVINLNVTNDGGAPILERGVVYSSSSSSPTTSNSKQIASGTTGGTTVPLSGLSSETTYYVRSYARNVINTTYGTYTSFKTSATQAANAPSVTTSSPASSSITSSSAEIPINIKDNNGYNVTEYGVVYSRYDENSNPEVGGYRCYTEYYTGNKSGSVTITLTGLDPDTKYAARAYAINSRGKGYGDVKTFTTDDDDGSPVVLTESASRISDTEIEVNINITNIGDSSITEKGVVYSRTVSNPTTSSGSKQKDSGTSKGKSTVSLTGLTSGSSYYVRAYATNRNGTSYGSVKQVTSNDYTVTTNAISDITPSGAIVGGTVSSAINSDVLERGIVYSRSSKSPTVNDTRVRSDRTTYGSYSLTLTGLNFNETYYVRAYIRTSDGYSYGNMVTFSTNTNLTVTVLYKTEDGLQVGSQNINAAYNATITQTALNVPYGYGLVNSYYSYTVTATTSTTVLVRKALQSAYMEGSSNYLFEPDKKITRIEVAKMIHSLKGNVYAGEGKTFHDMPTVQAELAALKYVTAKSYMVGDPDGRFRPYDPITRAEVVVICNTVYGLQSNDLINPFSDIDNHWAKNYIIIGYKNRALYGYPDGTFKPQANMTRAESVIVFANAEKRDLTPIGTVQFTDVPASHWAYKYIMNAAISKK